MVYRKAKRTAINTRRKAHKGIRKVNEFAKKNLSKSAQKTIVNKANKITRRVPKPIRNIVGLERKSKLR